MTPQERERITVVIPTKDEGQNLPWVLEKVKPYYGELIVVDGNSTDSTRDIAEAAGARVVLDDATGKGGALRIGARAATRDIVVFIDADGSHDPDAIPQMVAPILAGTADLVMGSRMRGGSDELHSSATEFIRLIGSEIITMTINYRFRRPSDRLSERLPRDPARDDAGHSHEGTHLHHRTGDGDEGVEEGIPSRRSPDA